MLVLSRRDKESIILETAEGEISLIFFIVGSQIKIGIDAPNSVNIIRSELRAKDLAQIDIVGEKPSNFEEAKTRKTNPVSTKITYAKKRPRSAHYLRQNRGTE